MGHPHRFYIPPETPSVEEVVLPAEEGRHALHVVRLRPGDRVVLFDGRGRELTGAIRRTTRREVVVAIENEQRVPPPRKSVALLQAALNREKTTETLIRRGTELGVARFCFFKGDHSDRAPRFTEKWRRVAIEACKQCRRAWLPQFEVAPDLRAAVDNVPETLLIATQHAEPTPLHQALADDPDGIAVLAGPEGDFSAEELGLARERGAVPVSLGRTTFRAEVAAAVVLALVFYELGELGPH